MTETVTCWAHVQNTLLLYTTHWPIEFQNIHCHALAHNGHHQVNFTQRKKWSKKRQPHFYRLFFSFSCVAAPVFYGFVSMNPAFKHRIYTEKAFYSQHKQKKRENILCTKMSPYKKLIQEEKTFSAEVFSHFFFGFSKKLFTWQILKKGENVSCKILLDKILQSKE